MELTQHIVDVPLHPFWESLSCLDKSKLSGGGGLLVTLINSQKTFQDIFFSELSDHIGGVVREFEIALTVSTVLYRGGSQSCRWEVSAV